MKWLKECLISGEKVTLEMVIEKNGRDFPLLLKLKETEQDPEWHAEGDVHIHTNMVMDELYKIFDENDFTIDEKYILLMSAIFHDIAKPLTSKWKEVRGKQHLTAKNHEYEGLSYLSYKFMSVDVDQTLAPHILNLVGYHQMPKLLVVKEDTNEWDYALLMEETAGYLFYFLELADMRGRETADYEAQLEYMELFKMYAEDYNCFSTTSNLEQRLRDLFAETFDETDEEALSYLVGKAKKRLSEKAIVDPIVVYQKYFERKNNHSTLFVMCGLSGSGKSTTVERIKSEKDISLVVELDALRKQHTQKSNNRREVDGRVRQEAKELLKAAFAKNENVIFDACNHRKDFRSIICDLAEEYFAKTVLVFVKTPFEQCVKNDRDRSVRTVGEAVIKKQLETFQYPEKLEFNEIYSQ